MSYQMENINKIWNYQKKKKTTVKILGKCNNQGENFTKEAKW